MNDATKDPTGTGPGWTDVWADAQKRYMEAWSRLTPSPSGADASAPWTAPVAQGLEYWTKLARDALPEQSRGLAKRLDDLSRGYLQVAQGIWKLAEGAQQAASAGADWQKAWQDQICNLQRSFGGLGGNFAPSVGLATFCGLPLQHFRQLASSLSSLPGDVEKALQEGGPLSPETLHRAMGSMLAAPTLGYTREWQEDLQQWMTLWLDHLQALRTYEETFTNVGSRATELFGSKLLEMAGEGKNLGGLRDAYNLSVDCAEAAYGEIAQTAEFARTQAQLTNTLMALKRHEQHLMTKLQGSLNIPTRRELDTTHCRVHHLRRELRVASSRIADLEASVKQLQALKEAILPLPGGAPSVQIAGPPPEARESKKAHSKKKHAGRTGKGG